MEFFSLFLCPDCRLSPRQWLLSHSDILRAMETDDDRPVIARSSVEDFESPLITASTRGDAKSVATILKSLKTVSTAQIHFALKVACSQNHPDVIKVLLQPFPVLSTALCSYILNQILYWSTARCQPDITRILLEDPRFRSLVNPELDGNRLLRRASQEGYVEIVKQLLNHPRVHRLDDLETALLGACKCGRLEVVRTLLQDPRIRPSSTDDAAFKSACEHGHVDIARALLRDPDVSPSAGKAYALRMAVKNGHLPIVKLLLADHRVDPKASHNFALRIAAKLGHEDIVELLLADRRVDVNDSQALYWACENGNLNIVRQIVTHSNLPLDWQTALSTAYNKEHTAIFQYLLTNPKSNPMYHPILLVLLRKNAILQEFE